MWSGVYTEAQAFRGEKVADDLHWMPRTSLDGGDSRPKLVGEMFLANWSSQPVSELFDWIRQTMPPEAAGVEQGRHGPGGGVSSSRTRCLRKQALPSKARNCAPFG